MIDVFNIRFYWGGRKESVQQLSMSINSLFLSMSEINSFFFEWCMTGNSRKQALNSSFEITTQNIESLFRSSKRKGETNESGFSELGFRLALYKEDESENEYGLRFFGGYEDDLFPNNLILSFWNLLKFSKAEILNLLKTMKTHLEPEFGCLVSKEFEELIEDTDNQIGWITLSEKQIEEKLLPNSIVSEKHANKYIYYLKDETKFFDYTLIEDFRKLKNLLLGAWSP